MMGKLMELVAVEPGTVAQSLILALTPWLRLFVCVNSR